MVNIEPSSEFENEVQQARASEPEAPSPLDDTPPQQQPVVAAVPTGPPPLPERVGPDKEKVNARRWLIESIVITVFALIVLGYSLLIIIPVLLSSVDSNFKFFTVLLFGLPGLFSLLILRRSEMARIVVIVFMALTIAFQFLPGGGVKLYVIAISLAVILFLASDRIKRHFL